MRQLITVRVKEMFSLREISNLWKEFEEHYQQKPKTGYYALNGYLGSYDPCRDNKVLAWVRVEDSGEETIATMLSPHEDSMPVSVYS